MCGLRGVVRDKLNGFGEWTVLAFSGAAEDQELLGGGVDVAESVACRGESDGGGDGGKVEEDVGDSFVGEDVEIHGDGGRGLVATWCPSWFYFTAVIGCSSHHWLLLVGLLSYCTILCDLDGDSFRLQSVQVLTEGLDGRDPSVGAIEKGDIGNDDETRRQPKRAGKTGVYHDEMCVR